VKIFRHSTPRLAAGSGEWEVLAVVVVITVIASLAVPNIGSINAGTGIPPEHNHAQCIVSMYQSAAEVGVKWRGATRNEKVASVLQGQAPADGPFAGRTFQVPNISSRDQRRCLKYIGVDASGALFYDHRGGQRGS
jgi:hypothetical protein